MSRPVRTLVYTTLYPSSARPVHGIFVETRLRELLSTGQVQTRVVAPVPWFPSTAPRFGEYATFARTPRRDRRNGIDVVYPRYPLIPRYGMTSAPLLMALTTLPAIRRIRAEGFDFDVIDAHYYYPDGVAAALLSRLLDRPLTITARGTDLNLIPQHAVPRRLIQWAAGRADASIGVCAALMDVLREYGIPNEKLHVMRNGVDLVRFAPQPQGLAREQLRIGLGPVLLLVGHLIERKGHHLVIEALAQVRRHYADARLYVIGEGPERPRLQSLVSDLGLGDAVQLLGQIPNVELARWYSAADMLVLASSREGWANVLLEAMACGAPVVATDIWGTPEVVTSPVAGSLVRQRSGEAFALAILGRLAMESDRAAVRRYAEGFGWAATSQAQLDLFRLLSAQTLGASP